MTDDELRAIAINYVLEYGRRQMDDFTIMLNLGVVPNAAHRRAYAKKVREYINRAKVTIKIDDMEVVR